MKRFKGYILLTRPVNCLIAFASIFMGGAVCGSIHPLEKLLLAALSGMFIAAGANAVNDFFDVSIDRINKPKRPLPSGMTGLKQAHAFSLLCFGTGVLTGVFIHVPGLIIAALSSILLYFYSLRLKSTVVWGNLTVAFVSGLAFVYGGLAVGKTREAAVVGLFAFFYHWAREMIKDAEDVTGDRAAGIRTLPIQYGIRTTLSWTTAVLTLLIVLTFIPYGIGLFGFAYLLTVVLGVDLFLIFVMISMWRNPDPKHLGRLAVWMKADMPIGLLAVFLGRGF